MPVQRPIAKRIIRFFASLKTAVIILAYLCCVIAIGTVVESRLDAQAAKANVYDSFWMYFGMGALSLSLLAVMADRWPWRRRHAPFLLAHVGIITIIFGSIMTMKYGLDGSMTIGVGEAQSHVTIPSPEIVIYASFGDRLSKVFEMPADLFKRDLAKNPVIFNSDAGEMIFDEFKPYVIPQRQIKPTKDLKLGPAVRFQITNNQFQQIDWLVQRNPETGVLQDLGPLRLRLGGRRGTDHRNEVILTAVGEDQMTYQVYSKDHDEVMKQGKVKEGESFDLGWMGLKLKVLRYHFKAQDQWDIVPRETPTPLTVPAVKLRFKGEDHWIILNDTLRLFTDTTAYFVSYVYQRVDLKFDVTLKEFVKENYAGTQKAMAYKSAVSVQGLGDREITMNEPLNFKGLTFYQASFVEDTFGKPTATVLSVNYDPGRWIKYFGSLIMTLGILLLFFNKRQKGAK
jgi:hypothetical protein